MIRRTLRARNRPWAILQANAARGVYSLSRNVPERLDDLVAAEAQPASAERLKRSERDVAR
jgi:hypothetical protein